MKYIVDVGRERRDVSIGPEGVSVDGEVVHAHLADLEGTPVRMVTIGSEVHRVAVRRSDEGKGKYTLWIDGQRFVVEALDERTRTIRDLTAASAADGRAKPLVAPMPGLIVRVNVQVGDQVQQGQGMVVMEAMKMENELRAATAGTVKAILASPGSAVEKGTVLVEME